MKVCVSVMLVMGWMAGVGPLGAEDGVGGGEEVKVELKPNVLVILADDMGWSDLGCYGSEIATPHLDELAKGGVRMTQFYNAARCCPTRASLLTGVYPHEAGMAKMVVAQPGVEGPDQGFLKAGLPTLGDVARAAGYGTYLSGKWHVGEFRPHWPIDRGFDHSYGLISGAMNYYDIRLGKKAGEVRVFANDAERLMPGGKDFYATNAFTDAALNRLREHRQKFPGKPWMLYLGYTAPHWPLHAPESLVNRNLARYRAGWEVIREERFRRQKELGLIGAEVKLSPADGAEWGRLTAEQKEEMARRMAVYAAMVESMDRGIGRMMQDLKKSGDWERTLVIFLSDNGASAEVGLLGHDFRPDLKGKTGEAQSYRSYGKSWSNVSNTPWRLHKAKVHEGGVRSPLILHWPAEVKRPGRVDGRVGHLVDIMATLREVTGQALPRGKAGEKAAVSLLPVIRDEAGGGERVLGWEHLGAAAWREGDWKLVRRNGRAAWELYRMDRDPTELEDLAAGEEERVKAMEASWRGIFGRGTGVAGGSGSSGE